MIVDMLTIPLGLIGFICWVFFIRNLFTYLRQDEGGK
jgi:hypothetical protein